MVNIAKLNLRISIINSILFDEENDLVNGRGRPGYQGGRICRRKKRKKEKSAIQVAAGARA